MQEFRIARRSDGAVRWIRTRAEAIADERGHVVRHIGIMRDVTEHRLAEERQALLMRELDHRAKNALAVVQAALRLTPKDDPEAYARAVEGRVAALARAHTMLARGRWV
ncbi:MAG: PAS domain S-box protein, partial [Acetobacteraceae bacterium]|nr:PAS domain S-box protein [Acetobacteraceae bacterium]